RGGSSRPATRSCWARPSWNSRSATPVDRGPSSVVRPCPAPPRPTPFPTALERFPMIRVECPSCGTPLRGPDEAAGKKTKCPKCGATVTLPAAHGEPIYEAEPLADAGAPGGGVDPYAVENPYQAPQPAGPGSDEQRRPCPVCGE